MDGIRPSLAMNILELFVLLFSTCSIVLEIQDIIYLGVYYFSEKSSRFFYLIAWINSALIWLGFLFRMSGNLVCLFPFLSFPFLSSNTYFCPGLIQAGEEVSMAIASIFAWFYALYFARGFAKFGIYVVSIREIIIRDLFRFMIVYFLVLIGFTLCKI